MGAYDGRALSLGGVMDQAIVQRAQAFISKITPNATCPMCGETHWSPLSDFVGFMAVAMKNGKDADDAAQSKEILDEFGDDISNLEMLRCEAIGFICTNCRYLRLHG